MNRKIKVTTAAAFIGMTTAAQIQQKPNILWIMAEDMGQDLECYGMKAVRTPNLNRMVEEGVIYRAACCTAPISSPSRSAMMTGVHQTVINAHNHRSNRDVPLGDGVKPITYYLREAGYTCILGNSNVMNKGRKTDCNFKHTPLGEWNGKNKFGLFDKYDEFTPEDQPFFAQVQLVVTHRGDWWKRVTAGSEHPVTPDSVELPPYLPDDARVRRQWASYLDQVEYMDNEVGMLMDELKRKGMMDNTIVFFIGDNGRCEVKGKGYLYEPGVKIPMIAWGKGIRPSEVKELVSTLDISATVLDLAGAEMPDYLDGKPLFDRATGKAARGRDTFYAARDNWDEIIDCMRSINTERYKYIRNYMPEKGWDEHQQYLEFHRPAIHVLRELKKDGRLSSVQMQFMEEKKPAEELYDLRNDPHETRNLAGLPQYENVLKDMRFRMDSWQKRHKDCGLKDMDRRVPEDMGDVRGYVMRNYPEEWKKLTDGEICDKYKKFASEARKDSKKNKKEKK